MSNDYRITVDSLLNTIQGAQTSLTCKLPELKDKFISLIASLEVLLATHASYLLIIRNFLRNVISTLCLWL